MINFKNYLTAAGCRYVIQENTIINYGKILPYYAGYTANFDGHLKLTVVAIFEIYVEQYELTIEKLKQHFNTQYFVFFNRESSHWYNTTTNKAITKPAIKSDKLFITEESSLTFLYKKEAQTLQQSEQQIRATFICWHLLMLYKRQEQLPTFAFYDLSFTKKVLQRQLATIGYWDMPIDHVLTTKSIDKMYNFMAILPTATASHMRVLYRQLQGPHLQSLSTTACYLHSMLQAMPLSGKVLLINEQPIPFYITLLEKPVSLTTIGSSHHTKLFQTLMTHSISTFTQYNNAALYDWIIDTTGNVTNAALYVPSLRPNGQLLIMHEAALEIPHEFQQRMQLCFTANEQLSHLQLQEEIL